MQQGVGNTFPSAVLLISDKKDILFHQSYGWLDPESRRHPTKKDSLFDIASLTKIFTSTAFLTLLDAKKVTLDTPIQTILSEFNGIRPITASLDPLTKQICPPEARFAEMLIDTSDVTFCHLLTHTSGLPATSELCEQADPSNLPKKLPHFFLNDFIQNINFAYPPERKLVYSDIGYILLGEAVARLSGMPLSDYLQKMLPFSSGQSAVPTELCEWRQRRCVGEVHDEKAACLGGFAGHAGLFATAKDIDTLGQVYLNDGLLGKSRILSADSVLEATSPQIRLEGIRRGFGWLLPDEHGASPVGSAVNKSSYGHTGFTGTSLWVDPERERVVALLTNRVYYGRDAEKIKAFRAKLHDAVFS